MNYALWYDKYAKFYNMCKIRRKWREKDGWKRHSKTKLCLLITKRKLIKYNWQPLLIKYFTDQTTNKTINWQKQYSRALHRYRRGHGFKSRTGLNFFQVLFTTTRFISVLSCKDPLISSFHRSANMWIFIYLKSLKTIPFDSQNDLILMCWNIRCFQPTTALFRPIL